MPTDREIVAAAEVLARFAQWDAAKGAQMKARAQLALEAAERVRNEDDLEAFGAGHPGVSRRDSEGGRKMKTLDELQRERDTARQAVIDWMNAEGAKGELRFNHQAPGWSEYERAETALKEAKASPEFLLAEIERLRGAST